jgi:hypothetical protein
MRRIALPVILIASLVTALAGCASDKRSEALTRTLMRYASAIRWGDFAGAATFVDPAYLEAHPMSAVEQSRLEQLRVTGYDEGSGPQADGDNVTQVVQINVVNVNTQAERTIIDRQQWHYDREKGRWNLMTGLPDFSPH